jgi:hypothetical protein
MDIQIKTIIKKNNLDLIISSFQSNIKNKKDVIIVSPVGDIKDVKNFEKYLKKEGIDKLADLLFVYRYNLDFISHKTNSICVKEKFPLGTSGAFFLAACLGYLFNYKVIVVSDINAYIDSKKSFIECLNLALKEKKVVFPIGSASEDISSKNISSYNVNGFAFYPREIFNITGFHTPYFFRGGEDFEFLERIKKVNLLEVKNNVYVYHQRSGYSIFHKLISKRKFYPYIAGLMKAHVFLSSNYFKYNLIFLIWHSYYSFFADVFSDSDLKKTINTVKDFSLFVPKQNSNEWFEIKQIHKKANYPKSWLERFLITLKMILSLILTKKAVIYTDEVILKKSRINFISGLLKASLFILFNFIKALFDLFEAKKNAKKFSYPIKPENAPEAIKIYLQLIKENLENIK